MVTLKCENNDGRDIYTKLLGYFFLMSVCFVTCDIPIESFLCETGIIALSPYRTDIIPVDFLL